MDNRPIGVFDSGLGGLTVVKELMAELPNEDIVYFGDTARIPYGTRSKEIVAKYSSQCVRFLKTQNVKMVVVACNTVSSCCLKLLRTKFHIPIVGVIEPGAQAAVSATINKKIGVIGTEGTISSAAYEKAILKRAPDISIYTKACSLFVSIVEEGWAETDVAYLTAKKYLENIKLEKIDTLVLGCTHFPLLTNVIGKTMGEEVTLIDPAEGTALMTKQILTENNMLNSDKNTGTYRFFVSDFGQRFEQIGSNFLGQDIECPKKIDIETY